MEQTRFEQGIEQLRKIDGIGGENVIKSLEDIAPDVGKYIIEFAFGDIYPRKELNLQEREMITITSLLTAGGCEPQLEVHINGSLNVGIAPEKIYPVYSLYRISEGVKCHFCGKKDFCRTRDNF